MSSLTPVPGADAPGDGRPPLRGEDAGPPRNLHLCLLSLRIDRCATVIGPLLPRTIEAGNHGLAVPRRGGELMPLGAWQTSLGSGILSCVAPSIDGPRVFQVRLAMHIRSARGFALTIFLAALAVLPALAQRGSRPGEKYALLIAVRQYEPSELRSLKYTEADVEALTEILLMSGYPKENIRVMTQTR